VITRLAAATALGLFAGLLCLGGCKDKGDGGLQLCTDNIEIWEGPLQ